MKTQHGSILLISLITLLIMTAVVTSLSVRTQYSSSITLGSVAYTESLVSVNTAQLSYLKSQAALQGNSLLVTLNSTDTESFDYADVEHELNYLTESSCRRTNTASAAQTFNCRHLQLTSGEDFGKDDLGRLDITSVVEQPVLNLSGGN